MSDISKFWVFKILKISEITRKNILYQNIKLYDDKKGDILI